MKDDKFTVMNKRAGLVDLLDRVVDKGVVVDGDIYLSVAGIELVYLKLKLLLAATATIEQFSSFLPAEASAPLLGGAGGYAPLPAEKNAARRDNRQIAIDNKQVEDEGLTARVLNYDEPAPRFAGKQDKAIDIDPKKVEQGLAKLILTLVELLRNLMEKQALRRVEKGRLTDKQIEQLGEAFMLLEEKMKELKKVFNLKDGDLNMDLGPLNDLL